MTAKEMLRIMFVILIVGILGTISVLTLSHFVGIWPFSRELLN